MGSGVEGRHLFTIKLMHIIIRFLGKIAARAAVKVLDFLIERDHRKSHKFRYIKGGYGVYDDRAERTMRTRRRLARAPPN